MKNSVIGVIALIGIGLFPLTIRAGSFPNFDNGNGGNWSDGYYRTISITNSGGVITDYQIALTPFTDISFLNNTGLVGSWHFSEATGTATADMSGNGNTATLINGPGWTDGKFGKTLAFNVANNYIVTPLIKLGDNFTVEFWMKPTNLHDYGDPLSAGTTDSWLTFLTYADGHMTYVIGNGMNGFNHTWGKAVSTSAGELTDGQWYHITGTYDGNQIELFVNGVSKGTAANKGYSLNQVINIGARPALGYYFAGSVDEVRLYNRVLSAAEIQTRYNYYTTKIRGDYADVRFATSDGKTELHYWQETDNKFWIKIPTLPPGDSAINMYYGNISATSVSSGSNTFIVYTAGEDATNWTGAPVRNVNGELYFESSGSIASTKPVSLTGNWVAEAKFKQIESSDTNLYFIIGDGFGYSWATNRNTQAYHDAGVTIWQTLSGVIYSSMALNTYYIAKEIRKEPNLYDHFLYDTNRQLLGKSLDTMCALNGNAEPVTGIQFGSGSGAWSTKSYVNWLFIRKYISAEPLVRLLPEELRPKNYIALINPTPLPQGNSGDVQPQIMFDLRLVPQYDAQQNSAHWKRLKIDKYVPPGATALPDDKIVISVWRESNNNNRWDDKDTLITKGQFQNGRVWLEMKEQEVTTTTQTFYLVYNIKSDAGKNQIAGLEIKDISYLESAEPDIWMRYDKTASFGEIAVTDAPGPADKDKALEMAINKETTAADYQSWSPYYDLVSKTVTEDRDNLAWRVTFSYHRPLARSVPGLSATQPPLPGATDLIRVIILPHTLKSEIEKLIKLLGDNDWQIREKATADLTAIGRPVISLLKAVLNNPDPEVRMRAKFILDKIP